MARTMRRAIERKRNPQKRHGGGKKRPQKRTQNHRERKSRTVQRRTKHAAKAKRGK